MMWNNGKIWKFKRLQPKENKGYSFNPVIRTELENLK